MMNVSNRIILGIEKNQCENMAKSPFTSTNLRPICRPLHISRSFCMSFSSLDRWFRHCSPDWKTCWLPPNWMTCPAFHFRRRWARWLPGCVDHVNRLRKIAHHWQTLNVTKPTRMCLHPLEGRHSSLRWPFNYGYSYLNCFRTESPQRTVPTRIERDFSLWIPLFLSYSDIRLICFCSNSNWLLICFRLRIQLISRYFRLTNNNLSAMRNDFNFSFDWRKAQTVWLFYTIYKIIKNKKNGKN